MGEKKIVVPEGMLMAAYSQSIQDADGVLRYFPSAGVQGMEMRGIARILESALRWLAENPIVPSEEQWTALIREMIDTQNPIFSFVPGRVSVVEWQRRMFLAPEPEFTPEKIEVFGNISTETMARHEWVKYEDYQTLLAAYQREMGQESK